MMSDRPSGWRSSSRVALAAIALSVCCSGRCRRDHAPRRIPGDGRLQRPHEPHRGALLPRRRVFVAEKSGLIKVFDSLTDTTPDRVRRPADEGPQLLGSRPARAGARSRTSRRTRTSTSSTRYDAAIGGTAPRWGTAGRPRRLPDPAGRDDDGCVVSGRLSRLQASGNAMTGAEQVLIEDWCQQYPSHSIGTSRSAPTARSTSAAATARASTSSTTARTAARSTRAATRPAASAATLTPPTAEGGALRSQDLRTTGDPAGAGRHRSSASIRRPAPACPTTRSRAAATRTRGASSPTASATRSASPSARARTSSGSATSAGTTGRRSTVVTTQPDATVENFGWPCYEGNGAPGRLRRREPEHLREPLRAAGRRGHAPVLHLPPRRQGRAGETLPDGQLLDRRDSRSTTGGELPGRYDGALFFADYSRDCIWVMRTGGNGAPDPATHVDLRRRAANPVDLEIGPDGDLFYVDFDGGTIRRIAYSRWRRQHPPDGLDGDASPRLGVRFGLRSRQPAADNLGVAGVQFKVDGVNAANEVTAPPYLPPLELRPPWTNGSHVLTATARDVAGNTTTSGPLAVVVSNAAGSTRYGE